MLAKKLDTLARYMAWPRTFNSEDKESKDENDDREYCVMSHAESLIVSSADLVMQHWFRSDPARWSANIVASLLQVAIKYVGSCTGKDRMRQHMESNNWPVAQTVEKVAEKFSDNVQINKLLLHPMRNHSFIADMFPVVECSLSKQHYALCSRRWTGLRMMSETLRIRVRGRSNRTSIG